MRSSLILGLIATATSFVVASASADTIDLSQHAKSTAAPNSMSPAHGGYGSGFSAIETHKGKGSKEGSFVELPNSSSSNSSGLMRPEGHWRDGRMALTAAFLSEIAYLESLAAQQAVMIPQGMQANRQGFSAIKAAAGLRGEPNQVTESLRSDAVSSVLDSALSRPSE
jgi:hypothetical protein